MPSTSTDSAKSCPHHRLWEKLSFLVALHHFTFPQNNLVYLLSVANLFLLGNSSVCFRGSMTIWPSRTPSQPLNTAQLSTWESLGSPSSASTGTQQTAASEPHLVCKGQLFIKKPAHLFTSSPSYRPVWHTVVVFWQFKVNFNWMSHGDVVCEHLAEVFFCAFVQIFLKNSKPRIYFET